MSLGTVVSRDNAVLVVVDQQERLLAAMERREQVVAASIRLVMTARLVGLPVVVTRQYPKGLGDIDPALRAAVSRAEQDGLSVRRIDKVAFDCFGDVGFVEALTCATRRQLVLVGIETHICVTQTALSALREEYDVHAIADACCSRDILDHTVALERMRAAGAAVSTSESVMYELVGRAATDEFRELLGIVRQ
jgi:nicotinamidase-related amidase